MNLNGQTPRDQAFYLACQWHLAVSDARDLARVYESEEILAVIAGAMDPAALNASFQRQAYQDFGGGRSGKAHSQGGGRRDHASYLLLEWHFAIDLRRYAQAEAILESIVAAMDVSRLAEAYRTQVADDVARVKANPSEMSRFTRTSDLDQAISRGITPKVILAPDPILLAIGKTWAEAGVSYES
jgi:hypothetical protein